ncbi:S-adenosyl-L-methionine-dependent methyltransferase [Fistulina hepatica ATCC 64428]|uniref:S-adenosyl-L-methionine-dependent methyltransferase n=1 Tax=Fistulina hepatica ATCC 64428 TaxID=1128425 RepID=A0A0D7ALN6_9AGAR|nr:S-adenosyl-L-methionine-dependent methyltransferase [Fistulina hepatica ATCC 64428]
MTTEVSPLRRLSNLISAAVDEIETVFETEHVPYPRLEDVFNLVSPTETIVRSPAVVNQAKIIAAAAGQLNALVNVPFATIMDSALGFYVTSALRVACEGLIVEILRDHPQGLHVNEIAALNGMDPGKISRTLRCLATSHIFEEVSPNVFRNNRLSSSLDTGKTVEAIRAAPEQKHNGTFGLSANLEPVSVFYLTRTVPITWLTSITDSGDEGMKSTAYLADVWVDPVMGHRDSMKHAFGVAFGSEKSVFEWFEEPQNKVRLARFTVALQGSRKMEPSDAYLGGFNWGALPAESVIVDVGGGSGHVLLSIARVHPRLRHVLQDRKALIPKAQEALHDLSSGKESFPIDFFKDQPVKNAAVFILSQVLHDWNYAQAVRILSHLRAAATKDTKLLIIEHVVQYACHNDIETPGDIAGLDKLQSPAVPPPLLPNFGRGNLLPYLVDLHMGSTLNGENRTIGAFQTVCAAAGWKITEGFSDAGPHSKQILAVPV